MTDDLCLDVSAHGGPVKLFKCHGMKGNQLWEYDKHSLAIRHVNSNQVYLEQRGVRERIKQCGASK